MKICVRGATLAAEHADLIQLVIDRRLNNPLMLFRHGGDVLQIQMRQQMIGNFVTYDSAGSIPDREPAGRAAAVRLSLH